MQDDCCAALAACCPVDLIAVDASSSVYDAVSAAMTTGIGQHLPGSAGLEGPGGGAGGGGSSNPSWRPRGVLASHLLEHRAAVNCLATSNNGALLLSGSDDETVKVIDSLIDQACKQSGRGPGPCCLPV